MPIVVMCLTSLFYIDIIEQRYALQHVYIYKINNLCRITFLRHIKKVNGWAYTIMERILEFFDL